MRRDAVVPVVVLDLDPGLDHSQEVIPLAFNRIHDVRAQPAVLLIGTFAMAKLLLHVVTIVITPYEIHRDEFLYLSMGEHLRLWAMDFPPAIALLAKLAGVLFGDSLFAIRIFPALAGVGIVILCGLIASELGGGRGAQALAMLAVLSAPLFTRPAALFQPVVFDQLCWTAGFLFLLRILKNPRQLRWWVLLGMAGGVGLLTKFSILFFGLGVLVALLATPHRSLLITRGPWTALIIALLIGSPTIAGQLSLGFPVLTHMSDLREGQLHRITYLEFLLGQFWMLGPASLLAIAGLVYLSAAEEAQPFRVIAISCVTGFLVIMVLQGKPYYIGPIYPALFAAGAVAFRTLRQTVRRTVQAWTFGGLALAGLVLLPLGLPVLVPEAMARYTAALGLHQAVRTNRGTVLRLPQDFADMLGWKLQVETLAKAFATLPPEMQTRTALVASNYGQAGAMEFYGPGFGLPRRIMLPQNYLLWPPIENCEVVLCIGVRPSDLREFFDEVTIVGRFDNEWMVEEERGLDICLGQRPIRNITEAWIRR